VKKVFDKSVQRAIKALRTLQHKLPERYHRDLGYSLYNLLHHYSIVHGEIIDKIIYEDREGTL
jgi:hypothetical protein